MILEQKETYLYKDINLLFVLFKWISLGPDEFFQYYFTETPLVWLLNIFNQIFCLVMLSLKTYPSVACSPL